VRDWLQAILGRDPRPISARPRSDPYTLDDWIAFRHAFADGDIDHVRHAFELLASGGRVVSVMCEGPFFRSDARSAAFREWLCSLNDAHDEELPDDAFKGVEAFRQTSVKTRLVILNKP
jgi:hypothetical protein